MFKVLFFFFFAFAAWANLTVETSGKGIDDASDLRAPLAPEDEVEDSRNRVGLWQPAVGAKWQIILNSTIALNRTTDLVPRDVRIWEVDLFDTPIQTFRELKRRGNRIICYFSAGTSEDWRPDFAKFKAVDKGTCLPEWVGERYVDIRKRSIFEIMQERIRLASQKGCDAIDPDNIDVFQNEQGFPSNITRDDALDYFKALAREAARYGISTGLKNAQVMLPNLTEVIQFAVNEECTMYDSKKDESCDIYEEFMKPKPNATTTPIPGRPTRRVRGKPVFHIEYATFTFPNTTTNATKTTTTAPAAATTPAGRGGRQGRPNRPSEPQLALPEMTNDSDELKNYTTSKALMDHYCAKGTKFEGLFSTTIKIMNLDGQVVYCDGTYANTKMNPLNPKLKGWAGECNITVKAHPEPAENGTTALPAAETAPFANGTATTTLVTPGGNVTIPTSAPTQPKWRHL